jgi:hypothetical protein
MLRSIGAAPNDANLEWRPSWAPFGAFGRGTPMCARLTPLVGASLVGALVHHDGQKRERAQDPPLQEHRRKHVVQLPFDVRAGSEGRS